MIRRAWWTKPDADAVLRGRVDHEHGLVYIPVRGTAVSSSLRVSSDVVLDLDGDGFLRGIELLKASGHVGPERLLVCGGRDFADFRLMFDVLDALNPRTVGHGAQRGADYLAGTWCLTRGVPAIPHPALWHLYGRAAGPIRNRAMYASFRPDLALAFPGGPGTADMVAVAMKGGTPVVRIAPRDDA